jgi:hypothetical protein
LSAIGVVREVTGPLIVTRTGNLLSKCDVFDMGERDIRLMLAISPNSSFSSFSTKEEIQDSPTETKEQEEVIKELGEVTKKQPREIMVGEDQLSEEGNKCKVLPFGP